MQFTYLINYISQKDSSCGFTIGNCQTEISCVINSMDRLELVKQSIIKDYDYEKASIIGFELVGFNPFKTPGKEKKNLKLKNIIWAFLNEEVYSFHFMLFLSFIWLFPFHKHPAAFFSILFVWLFVWLSLKMWVKE